MYNGKIIKVQVSLKALCNLKCSYCSIPNASKYENVGNYKNNEIINNAEKLFKKLYNAGYDIQAFSIFGAEPLVVHPRIVSGVINVVNKYYPKTGTKIQTNGTLLTKKYATELFDGIDNINNFTLGWSFDAVEDLQNKWRDNSYTIAKMNLENVIKNHSNIRNMCVITTQYAHYAVSKYRNELLDFINWCKTVGVLPTISFVDLDVSQTIRDTTISVGSQVMWQNALDFMIENDLLLHNMKQMNPMFCYRKGNECDKLLFDLSTNKMFQCEKTYDVNNAILGDIENTPIDDLIKTRYNATIDAPISNECSTCEFWSWCRGNCMLRRDINGKAKACEFIKAGLTHIRDNINPNWHEYLINNKVT